VHVAKIRTKGKGGKVYTSYLLRRSYREGGRVRHENLGNLSHLPEAAMEAVRRVLAGEVLVSAEDRFQVERSEVGGPLDDLVVDEVGRARSMNGGNLVRLIEAAEICLARIEFICCRLMAAPGRKVPSVASVPGCSSPFSPCPWSSSVPM